MIQSNSLRYTKETTAGKETQGKEKFYKQEFDVNHFADKQN